MNGQEIWIIFRKELLDSLRDKRTWRYSLLLPLVLVPLIMVAATLGMSDQNEALTAQRVPLAVAGAEHTPALISFLEGGGDFAVTSVADAQTALADGKAKVSIRIPPEFDADVRAGRQTGLEIYFDSTDSKGALLKERLLGSLQGYTQGLVTARLQQQGLDARVLQPFAAAVTDVAPEAQKQAGLLALMLPMILAVWGAAGGMHVAVDVTAGEKERGTMEPLLAAPVGRLSLVAGKYLTVLLAAVFAQVVSVVGFAVGFRLKAFFVADAVSGGLSLTWQTAGGLLLAALVLSALFAALELALCVQSRSIREAQSYQAPISFGAMLPWLLVAFMTPADLPGYLYYVPLLNSVALFKELILGIFRPEHLLWTVLTCGGAAYLVLRWGAGRFRQEAVVLRGI